MAEEDLILDRVRLRGMVKKLRVRAEDGDLPCPTCGALLRFRDAKALLFECGHEALAVPCPDRACEGRAGVLFEPPSGPGHVLDEPHVALPLERWLRL